MSYLPSNLGIHTFTSLLALSQPTNSHLCKSQIKECQRYKSVRACTRHQTVRMHQANQQQRPMAPGQVPPIRSTTVPSTQKRTGYVPLPQASRGLRVDTPLQDDDVLRREPQRPYAAIMNYQNVHSCQSSVSSSRSSEMYMVPIPAWVNEMNAPKPQRIHSTLLRNEGYVPSTHAHVVPADVAISLEKMTLRRDSATPTHSELFYGEEECGHRKAGPVYETRSDVYRDIQMPYTGSASMDAQIRIRRQEEEDMRRRTDSYETRAPNTPAVKANRTKCPAPRRLSLRLLVDPPLSENMFDGITGDIDVREVFGSVTANILSEMDISEASMNEYLPIDDGMLKKREEAVVEEKDDFRWITSAIKRS